MTVSGAAAEAGPDQDTAAPLPWLLRRVNQRFRRLTAARLAEAGFGDLPQPGYWAVMALDAGVHEHRRLAAELGVSKQAVSKLVEGLVVRGFVERRPDPADRRRSRLLLTDRGRAAAAVIDAATGAAETVLARQVGADAFEQLGRTLGRLARGEQ